MTDEKLTIFGRAFDEEEARKLIPPKEAQP
jgi:hypothetical protein